MKVAATFLAAASFASVVSAIPKPEANPEAKPDFARWWLHHHGGAHGCNVPGTACFSKRESKPDFAHWWLHHHSGSHGCNVPGTACFSKREADPDFAHWWLHHHGGSHGCNVPGTACFSKREADPDFAHWWLHHHGGSHGCNVPGTACFSKRNADPDFAHWWLHHHGGSHGCNVPGTACFSKREASYGSASDSAGLKSKRDTLLPEDESLGNDDISEDDFNALASGTWDADSDVPAITTSDNVTVGSVVGSCGVPGQPCDSVKRAAFAINDILKRHAESNPAPCSAADSFCESKRQELGAIASDAINGYDYVVAREAEAEAGPDFAHWWLHHHGGGHGCNAPGTACFSKRDVEAEAEAPSELIKYCDEGDSYCVRDKTADPEVANVVKRCTGPPAARKACHTIHEIHHRLHEFGHHKHHHNHHHGRKHNFAHWWLHHHKGSNGCNTPGTVCGSKRNAPPEDAAEVEQSGGIADTLYEINDAIAGIKREAGEYHDLGGDLLKHCEKGRCSPLTHAHVHAQKENWGEAEKAHHLAWSEIGPSHHAHPYFREIEKKVRDAVESLE